MIVVVLRISAPLWTPQANQFKALTGKRLICLT